jgi:hypothetical protein
VEESNKHRLESECSTSQAADNYTPAKVSFLRLFFFVDDNDDWTLSRPFPTLLSPNAREFNLIHVATFGGTIK